MGKKIEIKENVVYSTEEILLILDISKSTFMRLLRSKKIKVSRVGSQYRALGSDLLHMLRIYTK